MSTLTPSSPQPIAPWKPLFLSHISKLPSPEFVLGSLHPTACSTSPLPHTPRVRYLIYRGMWAALPPNRHNAAPANPRVYDSDMPTFTTDVRMEKVPEVFGTSHGHGSEAQSQGSGGGGQVEAVWWVKDVMTQWRVRGAAYVVGGDIEGEGEESSGVRTVKSEVGKRMRRVEAADGEGEWSWGRELTGHFGNLSPGMRGSFRNPPPGTPVGKPVEGGNLGLGQKVDDLEDPAARENFRVVIIRPEVVEQLDLSEPDKARRWRFTFVGDGSDRVEEGAEVIGEWMKEELWP